jgi:hypothetical protein
LYLGSILSVYKSAAKIKEVGSLSAELLDIALGFYEIMVSMDEILFEKLVLLRLLMSMQ